MQFPEFRVNLQLLCLMLWVLKVDSWPSVSTETLKWIYGAWRFDSEYEHPSIQFLRNFVPYRDLKDFECRKYKNSHAHFSKFGNSLRLRITLKYFEFISRTLDSIVRHLKLTEKVFKIISQIVEWFRRLGSNIWILKSLM